MNLLLYNHIPHVSLWRRLCTHARTHTHCTVYRVPSFLFPFLVPSPCCMLSQLRLCVFSLCSPISSVSPGGPHTLHDFISFLCSSAKPSSSQNKGFFFPLALYHTPHWERLFSLLKTLVYLSLLPENWFSNLTVKKSHLPKNWTKRGKTSGMGKGSISKNFEYVTITLRTDYQWLAAKPT